jgi:hypothetical protein
MSWPASVLLSLHSEKLTRAERMLAEGGLTRELFRLLVVSELLRRNESAGRRFGLLNPAGNEQTLLVTEGRQRLLTEYEGSLFCELVVKSHLWSECDRAIRLRRM